MEFFLTALSGVVRIQPKAFGDDRGYFSETWQERKFAAAGINAHFVQDNHSHSIRHTLRGLHYQIQQPQGKLVRVVQGAAFDVAVDLRSSSPTFGHWVGFELSAENQQMLWVPPGFAHGYLALSERVDFLYKCTAFYAPAHERAVRWDDPQVAVHWPLPAGTAPLLSPKDAIAPLLKDAERFP
jgi:dTDP-4-dehydrorhamnose 3,5-epimerase